MGCKIRRAGLGDLPDLITLFDAYRQFYGQPPNANAAERFLRERLRRDQSVILLARRETGEATGFTQLYPSFSSVSLAPVYVLNDLFVAPAARQSGVGGQLMTAARGFASCEGAVRLTLTTQVTNHAAQELYNKLGWQRDEAFHHYQLPL